MRRAAILFLLGCLFPLLLPAHEPGLSSLVVTFASSDTEARLILNDKDAGLLAARSGGFTEAAAAGWIEISSEDSRSPLLKQRISREGENIQIDYRFTALSGGMRVSSPMLSQLSFGHRQMLTVFNAEGAILSQCLLTAAEPDFVFRLEAAGTDPLGQAVPFLLLGIEHILTGYDHLLFLLALLIVCPNLGAAVRIITMFTLAHSITLTLAALHLVSLDAKIVEPVIAASILFVGVENMITKGAPVNWRWALVFLFGLIHGLGFAGALEESGIREVSTGVVLPLVAFNLGVECGQLGVAAAALPLIWWLRRRSPAFISAGVPACSLAIALAGGFWFFQRTFF